MLGKLLNGFVVFSVLTSLSFPAEARKKKPLTVQNLSGVVQSCHDGDTCRVLVEGRSLKIRFAGIDTPEISQHYGTQAKAFTESLIKDKTVDLECEGKSYDRITCTVFQAGLNVNAEIVRKGYAHDSPKYSHGAYKSYAEEAKAKKLGMWRGDQAAAISPYCFRHKTAKACKKNSSFMP